VAAGEPAHASLDRELVGRYEELRRRALGGEPDGHPLGLAMLVRHGMAAWIHARHSTVAVAGPARSERSTPAAADQLVAVLAAMALACTQGE